MKKKISKYPKIVYKYRNWSDEYNKRVLKDNELYLSSPTDFNDPFDCRINQNLFLLNTPEKQKQYAINVVQGNRDFLLNDGRNLYEEVEKIESQLRSDLARVQQMDDNIVFSDYNQIMGILSMSGRWDSILMWSHYSEKHTGYCIGYYEKKLRESRKFGHGGNVIYNSNDKFPNIDPLEPDIMVKAITQTHYKAKEWSYEKEYRFVTLFEPVNPIEPISIVNPLPKPNRIVQLDNEDIAEIIIGLSTPEDVEEEIIEISKKKGIKIYKATMAPRRFKLDRVEYR
jgi:hypothetical protein